MICIAVVGAKGTGKTTYIKENITKANKESLLLFDINEEYTDVYDKPFCDMDEFIEQADKTRNGIIVFEEATFFFSNKGYNKTTTRILQRSRHTKNMCVLVFHSIRTIPLYILELVNYWVIFKTIDTPPKVEQKFGKDHPIVQIYKEVSNSDNRHEYKIYTADRLPE